MDEQNCLMYITAPQGNLNTNSSKLQAKEKRLYCVYDFKQRMHKSKQDGAQTTTQTKRKEKKRERSHKVSIGPTLMPDYIRIAWDICHARSRANCTKWLVNVTDDKINLATEEEEGEFKTWLCFCHATAERISTGGCFRWELFIFLVGTKTEDEVTEI